MHLEIHDDIRRAATLPAEFYRSPEMFAACRERIFARSWQMIVGAEDYVRVPGDALPFVFMEGFLEEPLVLVRDEHDQVRCLSNVCTHRGNLLVWHPQRLQRVITCNYHGRRFALDGRFLHMPATEGMENFPCESDNLRQLPLGRWRQFLFTSLEPLVPFEEWIAGMERKVWFLPIEEFRFDPTRSRDYLVRAHWALYCDNYLEGFHIPFVHRSLAAALDCEAYRTELLPWGSCQVGIARGGEEVFELPPEHEDAGQQIAAYYFWLFPNIMFNFYPWGLSLNIVRPLEIGLTRVSFRSYVWRADKLSIGAGAELDRVEREDEAVVEAVQRGIQSRFYGAGRFSPSQEQGVHHFHRLIAKVLS
ncbi:MAG: aromatic ring-hydroxylating dioxygenase subunit alpha [Candidatus Kapabacteria bacterium]|nr:aromatic ring-hydroxylating dioxygenase subunit alpha [Candidatus Kapabacteria bacterium]